MELDRLTPRDVAVQIEAILGERPDGELVEFVFERSEGIPLFVEELLGRRARRERRPRLPAAVAARRAAGPRRAALRRGPARAAGRLGRGALGPRSACWRSSPGCPSPSSTPPCARRSSISCSSSTRPGAATGSATPWPRRRFTRTCCRASGRRLHRPTPRRSRAAPSSPAPGSTRRRCSPTTGSPPTTSRGRCRPRCAPGAPPPPPSAPAAAQRHFELALELWSQVPDAEQRAGIDHPDLLEAAADGGPAGRRGRPRARARRPGAGRGRLRRHARAPRDAARPRGRRSSRDLGRDEEGLAVLEQAVGLLPPDLPSRVSARVLSSLARALARIDRIDALGRAGPAGLRGGPGGRRRDDEKRSTPSSRSAHAMVYAGEIEAGLAAGQRGRPRRRGEPDSDLARRTGVRQHAPTCC